MFVVTGGGSGIGRAVALALHGMGEAVMVTGRRVEPLRALAREADGIAYVQCDNSSVADVKTLAESITEPIEGLVHCAGGNPAIGRAAPSTVAEEVALLEETVAANLGSVVATTSALLPLLADGSSVVLIGSIAAERGVGFYGPAKAAVASYGVGLAAQLGPRGIRVNCLSPGYIAGTDFFHGSMTEQRARQLAEQTLVGRVGEPDDVVETILFLLSPRSRHITGQNIHLNGGAFATR